LNISGPLDFAETHRLVSQFFIIEAFVGSSTKKYSQLSPLELPEIKFQDL